MGISFLKKSDFHLSNGVFPIFSLLLTAGKFVCRCAEKLLAHAIFYKNSAAGKFVAHAPDFH
jgi:hypothetical protein